MTIAISAAHAPADLQAVIARIAAAGWRIDEVRISPRATAASPTTR